MKIELNSGKTYQVLWCGESSIDERLRFCITGSDIGSVFSTFSNPSQAEEIKYYPSDTGSGGFKVFSGFNTLKGINEDNRGILVSLAKGD